LNQTALEQARDMISRIINESPTIVIIYRDSYVDNGFGDSVPDPFAGGEPVNILCRICHEKKAVEKTAVSVVGLSTAMSRYMIVKHDVTIRENESFEALGKIFRIGPIDRLEKFGGTIGYQAPLIEAGLTEEAGG
jgi:hypothetical protein